MIKIYDQTFWSHIKRFVGKDKRIQCPNCEISMPFFQGELVNNGVFYKCNCCKTTFTLNNEVDSRLQNMFD